MTTPQAIVLGLVQGLTEFLPISSSAHLILGSKLFGWPDQGLQFDMAANSGSLVAVVVFLRRTLAQLARGAGDALRGRATEAAAAASQVLVATLPVAVAGLLLQDLVATLGRGLAVLGVTSLVFGLLLAWADRRVPPGPKGTAWTWRSVVWVGLAQALALLPGTSRSGVTMTAGLFSGMSREHATHFSFVLAVPVGLLVAFKDGWDLFWAPAAGVSWAGQAVGSLTAAISAYAAIHWLLRWSRRHRFLPFAIYRVALGLLLLALAIF
ncbi:MAG: undecaprenyl-diphosphate phosphatase [Acidobacteriota bacterium]|nr:undecaprenyl-diphosphate phosphatase [Acidobacteriota bacterium]